VLPDNFGHLMKRLKKKAFILPKHFGHSAKVLTGKKKIRAIQEFVCWLILLGRLLSLKFFLLLPTIPHPLSHEKESVDKTNIRT